MADNDFIKNNIFVIDEKVGFFKAENAYSVYDSEGNRIGCIQQNLGYLQIIASLFISENLMPFELDIKDANDKVIASLSRGWTLFMSKISIKGSMGEEIANLKQNFGLRMKFEINDLAGSNIGTIQGTWSGWSFNITDQDGNLIGNISKKWNGISKEMFTDADKYVVVLNNNIQDPAKRMAVIAAAVSIDMIGHEKN